MEIIGLTEEGQLVPLTTPMALVAADFAQQYRLSFADALIYASAQQNQGPLVTADNHFAELPDVVYFPKQG